jgi:hypothetical protein
VGADVEEEGKWQCMLMLPTEAEQAGMHAIMYATMYDCIALLMDQQSQCALWGLLYSCFSVLQRH